MTRLSLLCLLAGLSGCLDGNSGITSSGTDGHTEAHLPVGDKGCYIVVGGDNSVHCPTQGGAP